MSKFKPNSNLMGEIVYLSARVRNFPGRPELAPHADDGDKRGSPCLIRAHWREGDRSYVTLAVAGTGEILDNVFLEWCRIAGGS